MSSSNSNAGPDPPKPHVPTDARPPADLHLPTAAPRPGDTDTAPAAAAATAQTSSSSSSSGEEYARAAHYVAVGALVASPVLLALPPRKLDLYTFAVAASGALAANHLVRERYGTGILGLAGSGQFASARERPAAMAMSGRGGGGMEQKGAEGADGHGSTEGRVVGAIHEAERRASAAFDAWSLPTERSRRLHDGLERAAEDARLRRLGRHHVAEHARLLRAHGWGYGGDMRARLRVARQAIYEDADGGAGDNTGAGEEIDVSEFVRQVLSSPADGTEHRRREALVSAADASVRGGVDRSRTRRSTYDYDYDGGGDGSSSSSSASEATGVRGVARKIWMGSETEGWKERRMREEREALDEGRGYGGLIADQIWEVWNWDKRKDENGDWVPKEDVQDSSSTRRRKGG